MIIIYFFNVSFNFIKQFLKIVNQESIYFILKTNIFSESTILSIMIIKCGHVINFNLELSI